MNKYLEGSIYQNNYYEGIAGLIACFFGAKLYSSLGKRATFVFSFSLALAGGIIIVLLENGHVPVYFVNMFNG
jgi:hypothetical protein